MAIEPIRRAVDGTGWSAVVAGLQAALRNLGCCATAASTVRSFREVQPRPEACPTGATYRSPR